MSAPLSTRFERLLRWYPRAWREENGDYLLAVLLEDAVERGKTKPTLADAWSIRVHGLAARATPGATLGVAVAALIVSLIPMATIFVSALMEPTWLRLGITGFQEFSGLLLLFLTVMMFGRRHGGKLTALAALSALALWVLHAAAAACARLSWSIGWEEADDNLLPGATSTWFGDSTSFWLVVAGALGIASLSVVFRGLLRRNRSAFEAWMLAGVISSSCLVALFITSMMPSIMPLAAGTMLVLSAIDVSRETAGARRSQLAARPDRPVHGRARQRRARFLILLVLAALTALAGAFCAALAIRGSSWSLAFRDSTHAMNVGLALGCLVVLPLAAVGAWMLFRRFGRRWLVGGAFLVAALLLEAGSQLAGAGHPAQEPLWVLAALCIGAAPTIPLTAMIPASRPVSAILAVGGSLVLALTVGLGVPGLPFIAPLASVAVACWAAVHLIVDARRSRADARTPSAGGGFQLAESP
ncbi:hypothetical protein C5E07_01575 [Pseudoclavibacter sp. RFBJ3]|uniref:hypothetical protein n=1 Tax=unclassified Pseudoclavibacter TaxID=2615177 RepID=UPI000CE9079B|nr:MULTISPECIES: hypothetical protein [unclassified Pseudoclavibacter]PPF86651.1 hypothetical protein C5C12_02790 [Pseudoclavibacter sp. RFBJ5]PPF94871.1 hypothetical protein C5C19_18235 [Pseudoclavibacter sp. RFBH5]PPF95383.1 hypothetical protein C5E07_01575 [Pseudoclavibacter sp. RFBJ3]PPG19457.1 hypothetical protein C5E13_16410 [Pseudoclavibacter sp. RFBI4]